MNDQVQAELKKIFNGRFSTSDPQEQIMLEEKILMIQFYLKQ